jgi:hypothetical protein
MTAARPVKRAALIVAGGVVLLLGVALLVLPGPGLLLVLAGLWLLAAEFPALKRYLDPVRDRAVKAARTACPRRGGSPRRWRWVWARATSRSPYALGQ